MKIKCPKCQKDFEVSATYYKFAMICDECKYEKPTDLPEWFKDILNPQ